MGRLEPFIVILALWGATVAIFPLLALLQRRILAIGVGAASRGRWRTVVLLKPAIELSGGRWSDSLAFGNEVTARVQGGDVSRAKLLIEDRLAQAEASELDLNYAITALVTASAYKAALRIQFRGDLAQTLMDGMSRVLCHINLAEAEYNLGLWDAAEERLRGLDLACGPFDITRAGLLQQRAWIAAHRGDAKAALALCDRVEVNWLPKEYHAEYHFTRAAAFLAAGSISDAEAAVRAGTKVARRLSSERNALVLFARIAASRGDWAAVERNCRAAANHPFRTQGGDGLLLWAEALEKLGRPAEAAAARTLVRERDPESEAAQSLDSHAAA